MVAMVVVTGGDGVAVAVDDVLDAAEVLDVAGDGDGALVVEAVLLLRLLEQPHEEGVAQVVHRHHEPLPLLPLPAHPYSHPPLPYPLLLLPSPPPMPRHDLVRQVQVQPHLPPSLFLPRLPALGEINRQQSRRIDLK
ncbi:unnamed protein product [Musa acuminata var. zebrina]